MKIFLAAILITLSVNNHIVSELQVAKEYSYSSSDILRSVESDKPCVNYNLVPLWFVASMEEVENNSCEQPGGLSKTILESKISHYQNIALESHHIHSP